MPALTNLLGLNLEPRELSFLQISLRGILVFVASLAMMRLANKRFLSNMSPFDALLGFIMASMLARVINGSGAFFPTLGAGFVIVGLHRLFATIAFHSEGFGDLVKGHADVLVRDGEPDAEAMRANKISQKDLLEELRLNGCVDKLEDVHTATIERSGEISVVPVEDKDK